MDSSTHTPGDGMAAQTRTIAGGNLMNNFARLQQMQMAPQGRGYMQ